MSADTNAERLLLYLKLKLIDIFRIFSYKRVKEHEKEID